MNNCCFNPLVQYNKITFGLLVTVEKCHAGSGEGYAGQQLLFQGDRYTHLIKTTRITFTLKATENLWPTTVFVDDFSDGQLPP